MTLTIVQIPVLADNYIYLLKAGAAVAAVDPALAPPVLEAAAARGWRISHILNTHWHPDHVGGNLAIKAVTGCTIIGPAGEADAIPGLDRAVGEGDAVQLDTLTLRVLEVPGHTRGHILYHEATAAVAFVGDTLFAMGCGRLFEGTPAQMFAALGKIAALPPETQLYCAHEYTAVNGRFALTVEPDNGALQARMAQVTALRAAGRATVPFTLAQELATNPFLRAGTLTEFTRRRRARDDFRG